MHSEPTTAADILGRAAELRAKFYGKPSKPKAIRVHVEDVQTAPPQPVLDTETLMALANPCVPETEWTDTPPERIRTSHVVEFVCKRFKITKRDLLSPMRDRNLSDARQIAMWMARHTVGCSLPMIGKQVGGRDHTTVLHGVRKIDDHVLRGTELGIRAAQALIAFRLLYGLDGGE